MYIDVINLSKYYNGKISSSGYDISGEIVPWVRYLRRNRTQGTISPEKSYPFNMGTISLGYDFSWVRFLLGTISPGYDFSSNRLSRRKWREVNTLHQCGSTFRSKNVSMLFLPRSIVSRNSSVVSALDFGSGGPGSIPRYGDYFFFLKVVLCCYFFNDGKIHIYPNQNSYLPQPYNMCLQHRFMNAVRDLYRYGCF